MAKKAPPDWIDIYSEWPASVEMVATEEKCTPRTVQKWCGKNNVRTIGRGNRFQFLIFRNDVLKFRERERPGRPWPEK